LFSVPSYASCFVIYHHYPGGVLQVTQQLSGILKVSALSGRCPRVN
jgi:hypothetical protein